jgi:glycosyltransferase involved in cell wall biosynthesis
LTSPGSDPTLPLVSIVLPTFNRGGILGDAIQCCLDQTWRNLEVVVVNDGSTDHTEAVALSFVHRDPRVKYVEQSNQKIPAALNTGFNHARGDFFTWTSDDNRYEPDAIAIMATRLMRDPDVGLVYCNVKVVNDDGQVIIVTDHRGCDLEMGNCIGSCFMYRRSVAEAVGEYDTTAFLAEDYDYWLRIHQRFRLGLINDAPYRYRLHKSSLTSTRGADVELQAAKVRMKYAKDDQDRRRIMTRAYSLAADELRQIGRFGSSAAYYLKSLGLSPKYAPAWRGLLASALRHRSRSGAQAL